MKTLTNIYHYLIIVLAVLTVSVLFVFYFQPVVQAQPATLPDGEITGWGWTDTIGWISLNCVNVYAGENEGQLARHCLAEGYADYGVNLDTETGAISDYGWATNIGWIDFNPDTNQGYIGSFPTTGNGLYDDPVQMDLATGYLSGWAVATFNDNDPNNNAWIRFRAGAKCVTGPPKAITKDNYCVRLNENDYLAGWAWSGGDNGIGWIQFEQTFSGGPYLATRYSDIYSRRTITGSRAPEGEYNVTYCVVSQSGEDTITLSSSRACLVGNIDIGFPAETEQVYQSSLVTLNLTELANLARASNTHITAATDNYDINTNLPSDGKLNRKVYYFTGVDNFKIDSIKTFYNGGTETPIYGDGTIVVDGNLYIKKDLMYETGIADDLSEVASVAWIVLGNVYIDPSVSKVVGTFIVLGDGIDIPGGGGVLYTGDDTGSPNQLVLKGMVVAEEINLQRTYFSGLAPAEIFEYDGRVLVNTPPGLANFIGYLPSWNR